MSINFENIKIGSHILYRTIKNGELVDVEMIITDNDWDMYARPIDSNIKKQIMRSAILEVL